MQIHDRIYGQFIIDDPLILRLVESEAMQRLKGINQYAGVDLIYPGEYGVTRFEHSIGVWHVTRTLGASQEVQVAALLHDIGHTAFSHMIDTAMSSASEDYHERFVHLLPGHDEVLRIVKEADITLQPTDSYPELKKSLPDVGADRIDYGVRDYVVSHGDAPELGRHVLESIRLDGRDIVFTDIHVAAEYARKGAQAMWDTIYHPRVAVVYQYLAEIIRQGFDEGWIKTEDILQDDTHLFGVMKEHKARLPEGHQNFLTHPFSVEETSCEGPYDVKHVKLKVRYFDPYVLHGGEKKPVSELEPGLKDEIMAMKARFEKRITGECFKLIWHV